MMAGIRDMMQFGAQQDPAAPPAGPAPAADNAAPDSQQGDATSSADDSDQSAVTPEEQHQYDQVVTNALSVIYPQGEGGDAQVSPSVLKGLNGSESPIMNLATTAVTMVIHLRDSAKQAGHPISDDVLFHAGLQIVQELAEVADAAKIHDYTDKEIEQSFYQALDMYRTAAEKTGDVNADDLKQGWSQMVQADRDGRLSDLSPELAQRAKDAESQPKPGQVVPRQPDDGGAQ
jgi:hypothetical protein